MQCIINGLTHCKVAHQLDAFMQTAPGRKIFLKPEQENEHDPLAIAAYMGVKKIGYVSRLTQAAAWAGLRGSGRPTLHGRVTEVCHNPKALTFEATVPILADVTELYSPTRFATWQYTGPRLPKSEEQETAEVAAYELLEMIAAGETGDEADEVFSTFMQLTRYDLSAEMSDLRGQLITALEQSACPEWKAAARDLHRLCSQMGGTHLKRELADRLVHTLPHSPEAARMMQRTRHVDTGQVRRELEALPYRLYDDYCTDPVLFVSRLLYAHIPWNKLNDMLSGITVLRLAKEQTAERAQPRPTAAVQGPVAGFHTLVTRPEQAALIVARLHLLMEGQLKPKDVMMPIRAAMDAGALKRPTWKQFCAEFGSDRISGKSSFSCYTNPESAPYTGEGFALITREFRAMMEQ